MHVRGDDPVDVSGSRFGTKKACVSLAAPGVSVSSSPKRVRFCRKVAWAAPAGSDAAPAPVGPYSQAVAHGQIAFDITIVAKHINRDRHFFDGCFQVIISDRSVIQT